ELPQTGEQLRYLALVADLGQIGELPVGRALVLRDRHQNPHGAIGEAHAAAFERIVEHPLPTLSHSALGHLDGMRELATHRSDTQIREHDHPHQTVGEHRERRAIIRAQIGVQDREDRPHRTLRGQLGKLARVLSLPAPLVHSGDEPSEDTVTQLQHASVARQGLAHQQPSEPGLLVKETQKGRQSAPDPLAPRPLRTISREHTRGDERQGILERRKEAVVAIGEHLIERAPRHTRTRHHMRDRDIRRAPLARDVEHRREDPRALDPHDLRVPRTKDPLAARAAPEATVLLTADAKPTVASPTRWSGSRHQHAPSRRERSSRALCPASREAARRKRPLAPRRQQAQRERERERERRVSDADASYNGPATGTTTLKCAIPQRKHAKKPSSPLRPGPSPKVPVSPRWMSTTKTDPYLTLCWTARY